MDNREAGSYDPDINNHPPACTCAECTKRRLGEKRSIWSTLGSRLSFDRTKKPPSPPLEQPTITKDKNRALGWILPAVLVFSFAFIGLGISIFVHTFIPLYLLLGFSLIFSVERWFYYLTRKYRYVGRLYRLSLNLAILCLLGLAIWSGVKLFSQQYFSSPLIGSLIFLAELTLFAWMWRVVSRNSWRWPSMKLTVFVSLVIVIVLAFAGVSPLSTYKDAIISGMSDLLSSISDEDQSTSGSGEQEEEEISSDIVLTYDSYVNEDIGFSINYPKDWRVSEDIALDGGERYKVSFNGSLNGDNNEIIICAYADSYAVWCNIFNTTTIADERVIEDGYINGTRYSQFHRDRYGEETQMYLFDCEEGAFLITWSFPSAGISGDAIDSCIKDMFESFSIDLSLITGTSSISSSGEYGNCFLGLVKTPDGVYQGNGCYGEFIVLINNEEAVNPTYAELIGFLSRDRTDGFPYQYVPPVIRFYYGDAEDRIDLARIQQIIDGTLHPEAPMICADFAERLHNNAELAGIRCGYINLDMTGYTDPNDLGIPSDSGHACNVFETTDRGIIYIDCTGTSNDYGPTNKDRVVEIQVGQQYNPEFLFPSEGWYTPSGQMGVVTDMFVIWDGDWR